MNITMKRYRQPRRVLTASILLAALAASPAQSQTGGVATQEMADRIAQRLALVPAGEGNPRITVQVKDGRYEVTGLVDGTDAYQDAMSALRGIEGLDMSLIDDRIVRQ